MAITGRDIQVWMCRVVKFSIRSAYTLFKNHPLVSCPLLFFLILYICFPSLFWISVYSSAFLILAVSITRIYLIRLRNAKNFRRDEENSDAESIRKYGVAKNGGTRHRNEKSFTRAPSVRRRKPQETSRDSYVHTSEDEKNTVFSSPFNNDMVDKSALTEEKPKEIREIGVDSFISHAECSSSNDASGLKPELRDAYHEGSRKRGGGGGDIEMESSEGTDEEDEQEREANNKAVQWTEADQKNLMDLGFSEIERNKRLESLIARRKARKLLSLQVRRSVVNTETLENRGPMTSVIPRNNNPFLASQSTGNVSPMPGSAPSVLLPMHNPFDLPYDRHEEKPNLTGGSFHQEFNDMTFSKPDSFSLGASLPGESKEGKQETSLSHDSTTKDRVSEGPPNSKVAGRLDEKDTDKITEVESCHSPKSKLNIVTADKVIKEGVPDSKQGTALVSNRQEERSSEVQSKSVMREDSNDKLSSASSSEEDVRIFRVDKDAVLKSLASPLMRSMSRNREASSQLGYAGNNHDTSVFNKKKMEEHFYHADEAMHHTPMSSIDSDLQVEVSEISSPEETDDESISCPDEEFPAHNGDMESESTAGNKDIGSTSSQLPRVDANDSRSKEIHDNNEGNAVEVGFSRTKKSEDHVLSHELSGKVIEQDATDSLSQSASTAELPDGSQEQSSGFHSNTGDNFQSSTSLDMSHALASDSLAFPVMDKVHQLKGSWMANISQIDGVEKPEQPSYASERSKRELNAICSADESKVLQLIEQGRREPTKLSETSSSKSVDYTGSQQEKMDEHHSILEPVGKNVDPKFSEDIELDLKDTKQDKIDESMATENNETIESIQVDEDERHIAEPTSGVQQNFSDHQVLALLPATVLEPVTIASGISSPRSVLQPHFAMDQSSLSNFSQDTHVEIRQFHPQRVEDSMLDEARGEDLTCTLPRSTMLLMVESTSHPLHEGKAEILQESSSHSTSTKEANSAGSVSEDMVHENESRENETYYIPEGSSESQESSNLSKSTKEDNSVESLSQNLIRENEIGQDMKVLPGGSSPNLDCPDSTAALSKRINRTNSDLPDVGQESSNFLTSTKEANSIGSVSKQVILEDEKKQSKTKDIPEGSSNSFNYDSKAALSKPIEESNSHLPFLASNEETNSMGYVSAQVTSESEKRQSAMKDIPEGSSGSLSPESTVALSKRIGESSSDLPHTGQESSNVSASTKEANSKRFVNEHIIHLNEKGENEAKDIPEGSSQSLSSPNSTPALSKPIEESNSLLPFSASNEEANSMGYVSEQVIPESERRQNATKDNPEGSSGSLSPESTLALSKGIGEISSDLPHTEQESSNVSPSTKEANSKRFVNKHIIHLTERGQNEAKDIPEGSSQTLSSPNSTPAPSKPREESNSHLPFLASNEGANSMGYVSEQVIPDSERRQNATKDILEGSSGSLSSESTVAFSKRTGEISSDLPHTGQESSNVSASTKEANSKRFINEYFLHLNENGQNEAKDIPEGSSQRLSSPDSTAALSNPMEEISSRSLTMADERSDELHKHEAKNEALPAWLNPVEQVNKLNTPIINREQEISQFQGNPVGVTYREEVMNSVEGEVQASTNATTSKDSQGTIDELQKSGSGKDHTGLLILLETNKVSTDKYLLKSAAKKRRRIQQSF